MSATIEKDSTVGSVGRCKEPDCTFDKDGLCYEGLADPKHCPNYIDSDSEYEEEIFDEDNGDDVNSTKESSGITQDTPSANLESVDLYTGKELDYTSSLRITLSALTRVIVLAGPNESGKTTLLASIYEQFLRGPIAGYLFAGSETLPALDERCHLSLITSGRQTEHTERTKSFSEETLLHIRVRDEALERQALDLLFLDINGELFKQAIRSTTEAERIKILKRADHLAVLVDGRRLANLKSRNQSASSASMILRSFFEAGMIGERTLVDILFTMDDLIKETEEVNNTTEFLSKVEEDIRAKYEQKLGRLRFSRIAARTGEGVDSYGIPELFRSWVEESAYLSTHAGNPSQVVPRIIKSSREFDRFAIRHLPHQFIESTE